MASRSPPTALAAVSAAASALAPSLPTLQLNRLSVSSIRMPPAAVAILAANAGVIPSALTACARAFGKRAAHSTTRAGLTRASVLPPLRSRSQSRQWQLAAALLTARRAPLHVAHVRAGPSAALVDRREKVSSTALSRL